MNKRNRVFIATSLDGYIADKNHGIEWLETFPIPKNIDMGYTAFTSEIDALVMGRNSFEKVLSFDIDWPYDKPVFVLSNTLTEIPVGLNEQVYFLKGTLEEILKQIHSKGYYNLYIDGGITIQNFLKNDLIDEMIITIIPVILGDGVPLFSKMSTQLKFECIESKLFLDKIVQNHFVRSKD
ncbi:MAG TPA: diacylglycerol kinase [Balneola sp.]|jgi:dihydrofolate reductase|nr:diacylglycerol kinase [Balneola sp.]MAO76898.1 diacylglycerol kinase [Balneola sp.]MBF64465.1 diacylglycerol kinase [Balneola sp.]MBF65717.1 diacylglycerol kinase [Balneola sp.]HAH52515.1 diacylglycerol kinase [Balneola sp.]|tara:strand:+ start:2339 stop:2881 length:543 start_codon:yes stop_codon:yes gene_type:complete